LELTQYRAPGPALDVGSFQGAVARALSGIYANVDLTACEAARQAGTPDVRHTDMLPDGPFGTIAFDAREYDPGLAAETVAAAAARLAPGGVLLTTARPADVRACFASVSVQESGEALVARSPRPAPAEFVAPWSGYEADFGGQTYRLLTGPGVFAPRGMDAGTRFMLAQIQSEPGARFLDLGSGIGVVSRIASEAWGCQATAVDVNARALRLTALNAPQAEVVAGDGFGALTGREFDIIASNPPYHTDYAVGKAFIEGAYAHLAIGGKLYLVVKRADWYVQKVRHIFGGCRVAEQDGYTVIITERRAAETRKAGPAGAPATTRKHAKRLEEAARKKRR
jgi:16S rRNA (guanine1207-N2)-methyltransferase